ncbi:translationally controlled tumor-associated [Hygrophoropsis aurantiaca]|uniref:Translationally controlled tumor-associated n=1 Tax=Hygrophoropsis aurantiaca TaxID=72124 RepID=A0ACB8ALV2_9AGAM|nr:translationally controlled tumor-associated [Hygrophoropsis aurantiaca]
MLLYLDILNNDELFSSAFDPKLVDGIVYEVNCRMVPKDDNTEVNIGANPSAEEQEEEGPLGGGGGDLIIDVVKNFKLQSVAFDKKSFLSVLKVYMKAVKAKLPADRVDGFTKGAEAFAKKIIANFKDYEFYTGATLDPDGMIVLLNYRDDGITPYLTFWKDGVVEMKT